MILTKANLSDFEALCGLYKTVADAMEASGLRQWHWGAYPNPDLLQKSLEDGSMYVVREGETLLAAVSVDCKTEPEHAAIHWLTGGKVGTLHRLAIAPEGQGKGLGKQMLADICDILRGQGCQSLHIDTHEENARALALYEKAGMRRCGALNYSMPGGDGLPHWVALEMPLTADCPLLPVRMHPAFRGGKLTPWGGEKLRTVYGKPIAEVPTGESLEVSCIPGLESVDDMGVKLPDLIAKYGAAFAGKYATGAFPLLLKFIDAAESLSVQVHPDDLYAHQNENGKLGKTEAWLILDAPAGSQLVYGIKAGTTLAELRTACEAGAAGSAGSKVEPLLRKVDVKPGDVCFIPAGCVHAIGAGIMLYEIQQSSDVTYRFYDWDRVDKNGNRRELHIDKALDVTDLAFTLDPIHAPNAGVVRVLDETYFTLDLMQVQGEVTVPPVVEFGLLTVLEGDLTLRWEGGLRGLEKGESYYLPTNCPTLKLGGTGRAALSMPR